MRYKDLPRDEKSKVLLADQVEFPIVYTLLKPLDNRLEFEMREPTVLDLEISNKEKTDIGRTIALLSNLLELSPDDVRKLGTRDFARLSNTVMAFL